MKRYLLSLLVVTALIATGFSQTVTTCSTGQYLDSENNECVNKTSVSATIQSTPQDFNFVVLFDNTAPYADSTALSEATTVTLKDSTIDVTTNPTFSIGFLDDEKTLARLGINAPEFTRYTVITVQFADLQDDDTTPFYVVSPAPFTTLPSSQLSQSDEDKITALTKLDRGLEYAWIAVTSLNPYAFLYMNTKLYRETLEMFKRINVPYGSFASKFMRENNNKVSGFKGPNIFPITVEGNSVSSGWNRGRENSIPYGDADRVQDLKAPTTEPVHNYDAFPLFLDNYGIQITVFFGIIALIIAVEVVNLLFCCNRRRQNNTAKSVRLFQGTRNFLRWNMLMGSIIGSFQSLTFYFMTQMKAYDLQEAHNSHDKLNFWFAIGSIVILGALFPLWLLHRIIAIPKNHKIGDDAQQEVPSAYLRYGMFLVIYNQMRRFVFTFPFALMLRAAVLSALTLFLPNHPVASTAAILAVTCVFVIYLVVLRPFKRAFYFIYQLINELVLVFYLGTLLFLANKGEDNIISDHDSDITGDIFIALWLFVPFLGIVFGLFDLLARIIRHYTHKKSPYLVPVPIEAAAGQQLAEGSSGKPVDFKIPSAMLTPKEKVAEGTPLSAGGAQAQTTDPMLLSQIINQITQEETYDFGGAKEEPPQVVSKPSVTIITPALEENILAIPRRTLPSVSNIEKIQPIVEEVEKEQASADLKQQVSSRIRKQPGWTTMSQARSSSASSPEPKDNMRRSHHVSFRDSQNVSRFEGSDAGGPRTQDKVKAMPVNLDVPSGRNSARSGYTRGLGYGLNMENVFPRLSANSRNSMRANNFLPPPPTMTMSQGRRTPRKIFE